MALRCKYVRLEMAKRMIVLLEPVQFYGSKYSAGVDNSDHPSLVTDHLSPLSYP